MINYAEGDGTPRFNRFFIPKLIPDIAPGVISIRHGFKGPNFATVSACASSANSLIDSLDYIRLGYSDIIVSGGSEAGVTIAGIGGLTLLKLCLHEMTLKLLQGLSTMIGMVLF